MQTNSVCKPTIDTKQGALVRQRKLIERIVDSGKKPKTVGDRLARKQQEYLNNVENGFIL